MKKLVIVNILLLIALSVLPSEKIVDRKEKSATDTTSNVACLEPNVVTSRSLEVSRSEQNNTETVQIATTYSNECVELIKKFEGLKLKAYKLDGEDNYTIGYGHSGTEVKEGQQITQEQAEQLLIADIKGYTDFILKQNLELNQNELDALVSFTYNLGPGNLRRLVKGRTKEEIAEHITAYTDSGNENNRKGLMKRRTEEKNLFLRGEK